MSKLRRQAAEEVDFPDIEVGRKINPEKSTALEEIVLYAKSRIPDRVLYEIFRKTIVNTFETTTLKMEDGTYFVFTGDLRAMWIRDSALQIYNYIFLAKYDSVLDRVVRGTIKRQMRALCRDPYLYAFFEDYSPRRRKDGHPLRKYELDSLCWPIWIAYKYWKYTGYEGVFDEDFAKGIESIVSTLETEQDHSKKSTYSALDNLSDNDKKRHLISKENPVAYTGLVWSGFRPSDDPCQYNYLIPSLALAKVTLEYLEEIVEKFYESILMDKIVKLRSDIESGIRMYGIYDDKKRGSLYAYEVDGMGNYNLMDDANYPSLLSLPWIGYCRKDDEIYKSTRSFILSHRNPYFYAGKVARGIGSPHRKGVWHLSLIMQALTSSSEQEIEEIIDMLASTTAGTYYMHEAFDPNRPESFTRKWFAWANTMFAHLMIERHSLLDCFENE